MAPQASKEVGGQTCLVTGAARGIGLALSRELVRRGAGTLIMVDRDEAALASSARELGAFPVTLDLADATAVTATLADIKAQHGHVSMLFSNAGILIPDSDSDVAGSADEDWYQCWDVNVMAHIRLVRELLPGMLESGGWVVMTVSAAGLLAYPHSATYSVSKHAALAYADYLFMRYGGDAFGVSVLCPQAVDTDMIAPYPDGGIAGLDGIVDPEEVARLALDAVVAGEYLVLPHPQVHDYVKRRADDHQRWLHGMRKISYPANN